MPAKRSHSWVRSLRRPQCAARGTTSRWPVSICRPAASTTLSRPAAPLAGGEPIDALRQGQTVTIRGKFSGYSHNVIDLRQSEVLRADPIPSDALPELLRDRLTCAELEEKKEADQAAIARLEELGVKANYGFLGAIVQLSADDLAEDEASSTPWPNNAPRSSISTCSPPRGSAFRCGAKADRNVSHLAVVFGQGVQPHR